MEPTDHLTNPLPGAQDILKAGSGIWAIQGQDHRVCLSQSIPSAPVKLLLQLDGQSEIRVRQRRTILSPNEFAILDGSQPFSATMDGRFDQVLVAIPRATFQRMHSGKLGPALTIHGDEGPEAMLRQLVQSIAGQVQDMTQAEIWRALSAITCLTANLYPETSSRSEIRLWRQAAALIDLELATITAPELAARLLVSRRYLDRVFAAKGVTVSSYLWEQRLLAAAEALRQDQLAPITRIAFAAGFQDSAHFSRRFKQRFGLTPRDWQQAKDSMA